MSKVWQTAVMMRRAILDGKSVLWLCATEAQAVELRVEYPHLAPYIKSTENVMEGDRAVAVVYDESKNITSTCSICGAEACAHLTAKSPIPVEHRQDFVDGVVKTPAKEMP